MKKLIQKLIYHKEFSGDSHEIKYSDIPDDLMPDDVIHIERNESYYSENESYDANTSLEIYRSIEETDEEYAKRIESEKKDAEYHKELRYEQYLKLKKEFE